MFSIKIPSQFSKRLLFSVVFLCVLLTNAAPTFAVPQPTLTTYRDLFGTYQGPDTVETKGTPGAIARTESGVYYIGATLFGPNTVAQLYLGANLMFPGATEQTSNSELQKTFWDFVIGDGDGVNEFFVIRTYQLVDGKPANITYQTKLYDRYFRKTGSSGTSSTVSSGIIGSTEFGTSASSDNLSQYGSTFFREENYTDTDGTKRDKYLINQKINVPITLSPTIPFGSTMGADFWYCGGEQNTGNTIGDGNFKGPTPEGYENRVAYFTDPELCGGGAYWKIGPSITFTLPKSAGDATGGAITTTQAQTGSSYTQGAGNVRDNNLPECSMTGGNLGSGSFTGCIAYLVYYLIYWPVAWFAGIMGKIFDFFLGYSLSDASYRAEFAVRGWQIVRDISNIFFIIILVYTGLMAALSNTNNMKKVVPQLILNALLINFSLFGTRVIIDLSNVVARVFYKSIHVCEGECTKVGGVVTNAKLGIAGFTPLSEKIVSAFNPQKIFSTDTISAASALPNNGTTTQGTANEKVRDRNSSEYAGYYIVVSLIAAFILFAVAMMFWKTAFFFVGRVIGLYMAMIFAPFAVLSRGGMPLIGNFDKISWSNWADDLIKYATLAPIFVFFLYVIYSFLETDFIKVYAGKVGTSFFETVVYIAIPMIIVYFMIKQGVSIAERYAGDIGKGVSKFVNSATGLVGGAALGIATGGAAFLGRNAIGRGLRLIGNGGKRTDAEGVETTRAVRWAANANNSWFTRQGSNMYSKTQTGSWDARNTKLGNLTQKAGGLLGAQMGTKFADNVSGSIYGLGKDSGKGGVVEVNKYLAKRKQELFEAKIDMSHLSDDEAKNAATKYKYDQIKKYGEANWEEHVTSDPKMEIVNDALKSALDAKARVEKDLEDIKKTGTTYEISLAQNKVNAAKTALKNKETYFNTAKNQIIKDIKDGKHSIDVSLKSAEKEKEEELSAYNVKDAASFGNMMRAEYVNGLQNASFMKKLVEGIDLTNPVSMLGTAAGTAILAIIPPLAPLVIAAMVTATAKEFTDEIVNNATGSNSKAVKAINKKAKTKTGTGDVLVDMESRLESLKAVITTAVKKDYDKVTDDEILDHTADLQGEVEDLNEEIKTKKGTPDVVKLRRERARALDSLEKLKNIRDKISRQIKDIDDHKAKKKKEENDIEDKKIAKKAKI